MSNNTINLIGWILFIISADGFIDSSIGRFWLIFFSVSFLVACLVFLIPFFRKSRDCGISNPSAMPAADCRLRHSPFLQGRSEGLNSGSAGPTYPV